MNKVLDTIYETADFIKTSRDTLKEVASKSEGNQFKASGQALNLIPNKYDASSSPNFDITNPVTGIKDHTVELRKNYKNYISADSKMNILYLQQEAYKQILYNGFNLLTVGLNSDTITKIIEDSMSDVKQVRNYIEEAKDLREKIYDYTEEVLDYWNIIRVILLVNYGLLIVAAIISLASITLGTLFYKSKYILKAFWIIHIIITLLLGSIAFPVAVFIAESSIVLEYDDLIYNRDVISESLWEVISVCLIGDGNLDAVYGITDDLNYLKELLEYFAMGIKEIYSDGKLKYPLSMIYIETV
jgi:hypothetical protein